ncbi:PQQ-dependent sugar dehydrogenase [Sphingorhabdus sp. EL138]|uniref:PQQ-dependent sugar dehydrogenase n=1 Tax=Sphingorhabdus sp. EL138 TaxID=2073156 RepID=UPI000D68EF62|nr:PQQ-dependent sugar dehydrogenase [Sphingorhabdus sp. EL138]
MRNALYLLAMGLVVASCSNQGASTSGEKSSQLAGRVDAAPVNYRFETVADGLDHPWSLAFLPDGDMLVTQRTGKLLHIGKDGKQQTIYDFNLGEKLPKVHFGDGMQAGLFDVVLHPQFETSRFVYISYAAKQGDDENTLLLMRFELADDGAVPKLANGKQLFAAAPARIQGNHYGARIAFQPDGTLLMPVGDAFHFREEAQNLDNHFGKIVRLNDDGSVPEDNPFVGKPGARAEIWSYGHRNPQGIIVDADGRVLENEHGPAGGDEINEIKRGANYGWPTVTYALDYSGGRVSPFEALDGTEQPLVHFTPSIAPSGFAQYAGEAFPDWQGDLFLSALALKHVRHVEMNADGSLGKQQELFGELNARFRDVRTGPDGHLYLLTEDQSGPNSKILRIVPK